MTKSELQIQQRGHKEANVYHIYKINILSY